MVKSFISSLGNGFFHFIGKVLAILFIGFVIYTIVTKLNVPTSDIISAHNLPIYGGILNEK